MDVSPLLGSIWSNLFTMSKESKQRKTRCNHGAEILPTEVEDAQYESIEIALIAEFLAKTFPRIIVPLRAKAQ